MEPVAKKLLGSFGPKDELGKSKLSFSLCSGTLDNDLHRKNEKAGSVGDILSASTTALESRNRCNALWITGRLEFSRILERAFQISVSTRVSIVGF